MNIPLAMVLLIVLAAEFTNGLTDAPNAIATVVATRVLSPFRAVVMAALLNVVHEHSRDAMAEAADIQISGNPFFNLSRVTISTPYLFSSQPRSRNRFWQDILPV